jgi:hypothetical protein
MQSFVDSFGIFTASSFGRFMANEATGVPLIRQVKSFAGGPWARQAAG